MSSGLVLVNEQSGPDSSAEDVRAAFAACDVEAFDPDTFEAQVRDAIAGGVEFVGVAGGDGTIRCVAQQLVGTDVALLPIPAGTRNHFARALDLDEIDKAAAATGDKGGRLAVDVGEVNGLVFLNNASIGLYPALVVEREKREKHLPKAIANIGAAWQQLWRGRKVTVTIEGTKLRVWTVFVGNGAYGEHLTTLLSRDSLTENVLDVRVVRADRRAARLRVFGALLTGRLARSPLVLTMAAREAVVDIRGSTAEVAVDGEVEVVTTPLRFRSRSRDLVVLLPPADP